MGVRDGLPRNLQITSRASPCRPYSCNKCPKALKKSKHLHRHRGSVIYCKKCGKHFSKRDKMNVHIEHVH